MLMINVVFFVREAEGDGIEVRGLRENVFNVRI
jgi:hypothetical protein